MKHFGSRHPVFSQFISLHVMSFIHAKPVCPYLFLPPLAEVHFLRASFMECTHDGSLMTSPGGTSLIIHLIGADH
ncbi:hypothetical protein ATANTOWER_005817 [Ataeniobius toweri]|uniref:Uncharacterized protein n=1 Tax=Ataeniobius toweri TaxID=208326 RepID=A0ABU7B533_9TELE|nr:hypothetical protein [Ataeniobius toweri]